MENQTAKEGRLTAIISHFWVIGLLIAFVLNMNKRNSFSSFYIRQMIGLNLLQLINVYIIYSYLGSFIGWIVGVIIFILWAISLIGALKSEEKLVPVVGEQFQQWFNNF